MTIMWKDIAVYLSGYMLALIWVRYILKRMGKWDKPYYPIAAAVIALLSWVIIIGLIISEIARHPDDNYKV